MIVWKFAILLGVQCFVARFADGRVNLPIMELRHQRLAGRHLPDGADGGAGLRVGDDGVTAGERRQWAERIECPCKVLQLQLAFRHDAFARLRQPADEILQVLPALRNHTRAGQQQALPGLLQHPAVLRQALSRVLLPQAVREMVQFLRELLKLGKRPLLETAPEQ